MLLDTHVWVWAVNGGTTLGPNTRRRLHKATLSLPRTVYVSTASIFEVTALHTAGRLQLNQPVERWIREAIDRPNLRVLEITQDIAIDAGLIPASALPDPFDRCLVASAREHDLPLVTRDRRILDYAKQTGSVRAADASA